MGTTERLAVAILADRERPTSQHNIASCFSCGQTFVYKGRKGAASIWIGSDDDGHHSPDTSLNGRFCSKRCQDWHDAANPSYEQQREHERKLLVAPLDSFVVVAGPPNIEVGSKHHQRQTTPMRRGSEGFYVGLCTLPEGVREQGPAVLYPQLRKRLSRKRGQQGHHGRGWDRAKRQTPVRAMWEGHPQVAQWSEGREQ